MKKIILFILTCVYGVITHAQKSPCGTDELHRELLRRYPQLQQKAGKTEHGTAAKTTAAVDTNTYDVPFVIHVIHDYGTDYISDDSIKVAFEDWARVFMKENADTTDVIDPFKGYIGNTKFRFHLATISPTGLPTKGITRRQSYLTNNGDDQAKFDQWPQDKYVNIWFVNTIQYATAYAYFPYMAAATPWYDGPICMAGAVNLVRVIPHELGHYFYLHHTWGDIGCGVDCSSTDSVDDTPPTMGHPSTYCVASALYDVTCATGYMVHYTDVLGADSVVDYPDTTNAQNIMDYTFCPKMFTKGQSHRMRGCITSPVAGRNNLTTPANLAATGALAPWPDLPPVADFTVNKATGAGLINDLRSYFLTVGNAGSFQFRNTSWNDTVTSLLWKFSNGATTPAAVTEIVDNKFSLPGWVTVSLTATSNAGSHTLVHSEAVYAADTTPVGGIGYMQTFGSTASVGNWPMFNYYRNPFKWELYTGAGKDDNSCVRFRSFDQTANDVHPRTIGTAVGDFDDMCTPAFDLAGVTEAVYLNFFTTGASTLAGIGSWDPLVLDTLEVFVSNTGGARWEKIGTIDGYDLQNNGIFATEFVPGTAPEWVPRSIFLPASYRTHNTFFRFRYRPGNTGNNLYLDNFSIDGVTASVQESLKTSRNSFSVVPNPAKTNCNLVFRSGAEGNVAYVIRDIAGRRVDAGNIVAEPHSIINYAIDLQRVQAAGVYFVTVTVDGLNLTQKLIVNQ